jgi:hypothetical protein
MRMVLLNYRLKKFGVGFVNVPRVHLSLDLAVQPCLAITESFLMDYWWSRTSENTSVSLSSNLSGKKEEKLSKSLTNNSLEEIDQCLRLFHLPFSREVSFSNPKAPCIWPAQSTVHTHPSLINTQYTQHTDDYTQGYRGAKVRIPS